MFGLTPRRVFFIAFFVAAIFLAKQYVPPFFSRFQFGDSVRQTVKYAAAARKTSDTVRREIAAAAEEYEIPITAEDIKIVKRGPSFSVDIDYTWPINLRVHQHDLKFHVSESGEIFEK
jgi:hypothetical protein